MRHIVLRVVPEPGCHLWVLERAPRVPQPRGSKQFNLHRVSRGGSGSAKGPVEDGARGPAGPLPAAGPPQDTQGARLLWC